MASTTLPGRLSLNCLSACNTCGGAALAVQLEMAAIEDAHNLSCTTRLPRPGKAHIAQDFALLSAISQQGAMGMWGV